MEDPKRLQDEAQKRGWLSERYSQSEIRGAMLPNGVVLIQDVASMGGICLGLSAVWCARRLRGLGVDFQGADGVSTMPALATQVQRRHMSSDREFNEPNIDSWVEPLTIAAYARSTVDDYLPRFTQTLDRAIGTFPTTRDATGPRVFLFVFKGVPLKADAWRHAIAFEADGPVFRLFDPNYGQFYTNGLGPMRSFIEWFFEATGYREMRVKYLAITRMRLAS
jgi:hypothetical protein